MSYFAPNIPTSKHCFFDRLGGISQGLYASRNTAFASQDNKQNIISNLTLSAQQFGLVYDNIALLHESISNQAVFISNSTIYQTDADGMVANRPGILLSLYTADCCPVLFYDKANQVIGAAHAGWRGALGGILENTLDLMLQHGAQKSSLTAALGPCLQTKSFECQQDMYLQFINQDQTYATFFTPQADNEHFQFDIEGFIISRLKNYGLTNISASHIDTYSNTDYFSYRRNCHQNLIHTPKDYPAQLSTITL